MNVLETLITEKKCQHCQRTLPISSFYQYKRSNDGRDIYCRECRDAMDKARIQNAVQISEQAKKNMEIKPKVKEQKDAAILYADIKHVSDEDIVKEIRRRGYTGQLEYSKVVTI